MRSRRASRSKTNPSNLSGSTSSHTEKQGSKPWSLCIRDSSSPRTRHQPSVFLEGSISTRSPSGTISLSISFNSEMKDRKVAFLSRASEAASSTFSSVSPSTQCEGTRGDEPQTSSRGTLCLRSCIEQHSAPSSSTVLPHKSINLERSSLATSFLAVMS